MLECPCSWLPSLQTWAQTFSQTSFPVQERPLSRGIIIALFAKPPLLLCGAAHPTRLLQAGERLPMMSSPASAAAWEDLAQEVAAMHHQNPLPQTSFHHTFALLAFHRWKSLGCLEAGESISCTSGRSVYGQAWLELTVMCMTGKGPRPFCKPPYCQRQKSSNEN